MGKNEDILEKMIQDKMKGNSLVVAVILKEPHDYDKEKGELEFKPLIKRRIREHQQEILNCNHPTVDWTNTSRIKCIIFGVTEELKKDESYFGSFLKACQGDEVPIFVGIRKIYLY